MKNNQKYALILCVLLVITGCLVDWGALKAKYTLSQAGYKELGPTLLIEKIETGETDTALLIVRSGAINRAEPSVIKQILQSALSQQNLSVAEAVLPKCDALKKEDLDDCIRFSVTNRLLNSTEWLVGKGFSREVEMDGERSPLDWSIEQADEESADHLMKLGFPLTQTQGEMSTLEYALNTNSSAKMIQALIEYGADQNSFTVDNEPLLHMALTNSSNDVVAAMLNSETDLNIVNALGVTAFQKAIETKDLAKVKALTDTGVDLSYLNPHGGNYLDTAIRLGDTPKIIKHLISVGLDTQHCNSEGRNSLEHAYWYQRPLSAVALKQSGATASDDFFIKSYSAGEQTPLDTMFRSGLHSPDASLLNGDTLVIDSIINRRYEMLSFLITHNVDLNLAGVDKEPPLAYAVAMQDHRAAELLLANGAQAQFTHQDTVAPSFLELLQTDGVIKWFMDKDSRITPLMVACDQGDLQMCKLLKQYGAKESSTKKHRFWAGNFAARRSKTDVVQFMLGAEPGNRDRTVVVDLSSQRATVYNKDKKTVMSFRISSGKKGHATRRGEFVVTSQKVNHVSTIYDVDMPYFQRLSYSDFGFHTGIVPGYPASKGCIRCPSSYAKKLYNYLKIGDVVTIQK